VKRIPVATAAACICAAAFAAPALADGWTFTQNQRDDGTYVLDISVTYSQVGQEPRNLNSGVGTLELLIPDGRVTVEPLDSSAHTCAATDGAAGQAGTTVTCSSDGMPTDGGTAFPATATVRLASKDCYSAPITANMWAAPYAPAAAADNSYTLNDSVGCPSVEIVQPVMDTKPLACVAPNVRGMRLASAVRALRNARCAKGRVRVKRGPQSRRGRVVSQSVRPGTRLRRGARIGLVVGR
jgi:hypothetical protein